MLLPTTACTALSVPVIAALHVDAPLRRAVSDEVTTLTFTECVEVLVCGESKYVTDLPVYS